VVAFFYLLPVIPVKFLTLAKNPKFNFYVNDFEGGTRHMTDEEVGCYMRLMLAQFNRGGKLPNDIKFLSRYCDSLDRSWDVVSEKFPETDSGKYRQNERMEIERVKSEEYSESRKANRQKKDMKNISNTYVSHMGNGNGNGKYSVLRGEKFSEDLKQVLFKDGSSQDLGESQLFMLSQGQLRAKDIFKGNIY